jgi:hypothetical protein
VYNQHKPFIYLDLIFKNRTYLLEGILNDRLGLK